MSLESLFPENKTLKFGDKDFIIREFVAHEFPAVVRLASTMSSTSQEEVVTMIDAHLESVLKLLSSVTGQPVDLLSKIRMQVLLKLIEAVIEENIDFFVQELPMAIRRVGAKMTGSRLSNF